MMRLALSLLCLILPYLVLADECSDIDLRSDVLGPPRDQISFGWCYAMTAADLISHKLNTRVSGIDVAITNVSEKGLREKLNSLLSNMQPSEGGDTMTAIKRALNKGLCSASDMPESEKGAIAAFKLLSDISELEEHQNNFRKTFPERIPGRHRCERNPVDYLLPNLNLAQYAEIFKEVSAPEIASTLRDTNCKNKIRSSKGLKVERRIGLSKSSSREIIKDLNSQLQNGKIVAIEYDPNFFLKPQH